MPLCQSAQLVGGTGTTPTAQQGPVLKVVYVQGIEHRQHPQAGHEVAPGPQPHIQGKTKAKLL